MKSIMRITTSLSRYLAALIILATVVFAPSVASASPLTQFGACSGGRILTFPAWYNKLECGSDGAPQLTKLNDIWKIALNIVELLIMLAAYVAAGYIIWAGVKYIKSRGDPGKIAEAKTGITQAVIGLGIALASVAIVEFVTGII